MTAKNFILSILCAIGTLTAGADPSYACTDIRDMRMSQPPAGVKPLYGLSEAERQLFDSATNSLLADLTSLANDIKRGKVPVSRAEQLIRMRLREFAASVPFRVTEFQSSDTCQRVEVVIPPDLKDVRIGVGDNGWIVLSIAAGENGKTTGIKTTGIWMLTYPD